MRRGLAWAVAVPLMLAGSQAAHALAYRWAYPQAHMRLRTLLDTGHGYFTWLPLVFGIAGAAALVSLALAARDATRGRHHSGLPAAAFALLPPLGFVLQEVLELSLHTGTFGWRALLAPTFLPGLVLQLPFALAAYLATRLLLRAAVRIGRALGPRRRPLRAERRFGSGRAALRPRALAVRVTARAPPCIAAV
jgi:hypothetical protein